MWDTFQTSGGRNLPQRRRQVGIFARSVENHVPAQHALQLFDSWFERFPTWDEFQAALLQKSCPEFGSGWELKTMFQRNMHCNQKVDTEDNVLADQKLIQQRPSGNSRAAALSRLKRDAPELFEKVLKLKTMFQHNMVCNLSAGGYPPQTRRAKVENHVLQRNMVCNLFFLILRKTQKG